MIALLVLFFISWSAEARVSEKSLAPQYRHWLSVEVPYIIESDERREFLDLHSDAERDSFIRQFWQSRNPTPGAPNNPYKDEHYRRFAYANEHFGDPKFENGWRTDQGQIYIKLGQPQSITTYPNERNVRPLIAWFYQSTSPALPPYFYILFYKRSTGEPYTIYSPYQDGPNRLVTGLEDLNVQKRSLQTIRKSLGDEVARMTISLIPSEPVNLNDYSPTMISDTLLSTIRGLPDNYLEKQAVARRRRDEKVTASIYTASNNPTAGYMVSRDEQGHSTLNFLIQFPEADPSLIGVRKDKSVGYDMTLQSHVLTADGKPVYDEVDILTGHLEPGQADVAKRKPFAAEERFPLAPGKYIIEASLTNNLNLQAHRVSEQVEVPAASAAHLGISNAVVFSGNPVRDDGDSLPFSFANLRFSPRSATVATIHPGDAVPCIFQLWLPREQDGAIKKAPVELHYVIAPASLSGRALQEVDETVDPANSDPGGNLLTGHKFETADLLPGNYRVVIRATQAGSAPASTFLTLHVVQGDAPVGTWTAYGPPQPGQDQGKRELSAKAQSLP